MRAFCGLLLMLSATGLYATTIADTLSYNTGKQFAGTIRLSQSGTVTQSISISSGALSATVTTGTYQADYFDLATRDVCSETWTVPSSGTITVLTARGTAQCQVRAASDPTPTAGTGSNATTVNGASLSTTGKVQKSNSSGQLVDATAGTDYQAPLGANAYDPYNAAANAIATALLKSNLLSDLTDKPTARANLGLGSMATQAIPATPGIVYTAGAGLATATPTQIGAPWNCPDASPYLQKNGGCGAGAATASSMQLANTGSMPACSSTTNRTFWMPAPVAGQTQPFYVCAKAANDSYNWIQVF